MSSVRVFFPRFDQAGLLRHLAERLEALKEVLSLLRVVLFGSWARGNFTVASDIDLLVVYRGACREDAFAVVKKTMNIPALEPHVYSEEEYRRLESQIDRMTEEGIVLFSER